MAIGHLLVGALTTPFVQFPTSYSMIRGFPKGFGNNPVIVLEFDLLCDDGINMIVAFWH
jgi:hypothetical protein